jgi:signal transduction histidine kinase
MIGFDTLAARLVGSLLAVLLISQGLSVLVFARQQLANEQFNRERQFFRQGETAADVVDSLQPFERLAALRSFNRRDTQFFIGQTPFVTEPAQDEATTQSLPPNMSIQRLADPRSLWERYLKDATDDPPPPPQRRPRADQPEFRGPPERRPPERGPLDAGPPNGGPGNNNPSAIALKLSLPLSDGTWLNGRMQWPDRPPPWVVPLLAQAVISAIGLTLVAVVLVRANTKSLKKLAVAAEKVGRGEEAEPLDEKGPAEIKRTAQAFNAMTERLKRMIYGRTRMLAAISHDLRTPITALRIRAELVDDTENRERMLATLEEMQSLAEATLTLARQDAVQEETQTVDLAALVESVCDDLADIGQAVTFAGAPRTPYPCRAGNLKRVMRNLVENAVKYGTRADVAMEQTPGGILIHIDDAGPGIPPTEFKRMFQPFVRLEESRSKDTGGFGLGLSIAQSIVHSHGGEITLTNRSGGGLRATIMLPAVDVTA